MAAGVGQFFCATVRANTQQLASVSPQVLPGGAGLCPWEAGQERQTGLAQKRTRNDTQEPNVLTKRLFAKKRHLFAGDRFESLRDLDWHVSASRIGWRH